MQEPTGVDDIVSQVIAAEIAARTWGNPTVLIVPILARTGDDSLLGGRSRGLKISRGFKSYEASEACFLSLISA